MPEQGPSWLRLGAREEAVAEEHKYWAFISYSHADEAWARWLHRSIETYRVPRALVGRPHRFGTVPKRLFPVFRDRDELPSSHELGAVINRALAASRYLIVVCSPRSATSRWVNEEIRAFRAMGRDDRVLCLVVNGEPHASVTADGAFAECFPPALRTEGFEPLAADTRPRRDGKVDAKLKLLSGMLGVGLDELKQRERQRRFWQRVQAVAAGTAVVALVAGVWLWQASVREHEGHERHLATLLERGRAELDAQRGARAAVYLNAARAALPPEDSRHKALRFRLARAMQSVDPAEASAEIPRKPYSEVHVLPGRRLLLCEPDSTLVVDSDTLAARHELDAPTFEFADMDRCVLSADGRRVARQRSNRGEGSRLLAVWEVESGRVLFERKDQDVYELALSGTGEQLAIAGRGAIDVVSLDAKGPALRLPIEASELAFLDGGELLVGGSRGGLEIWSLARQQRVRRFHGLASEVEALAPSPDGSAILASDNRGLVRLWRRADGSLLSAAGHATPVMGVHWSGDGSRYLTLGMEAIRVWDAHDGRLLLNFNESDLLNVRRAWLSHDGRSLFQLGSAGVWVWNVTASQPLYLVDGHAGASTAFAHDEASQKLYVAGSDGRLSAWQLRRHGVRLLPHSPTPPGSTLDPGVYSGRFDAQGMRAVTAGSAGDVRIWNVADGRLLRQWVVGPRGVNVAHFIDDEHVLTAEPGSRFRIWNLASGESRTLTDTGGTSPTWNSIEAPPSSPWVLTFTGQSERPSVWEKAGPGVLRQVTGLPEGWVRIPESGPGLFLLAKERWIARYDAPGAQLRWRMCGGKPHEPGPCEDKSTWFGILNGNWMTGQGKRDVVRDPETGAVVRDLFLGHDIHDSDSRLAVGITCDSTPSVTWLATGETRPLRGHRGAATDCRFSPADDPYSTAADGVLIMWDPLTGERLDVAARHGAAIIDKAFDAAGETLLTTSHDMTAALWPVGRERRTVEDVDQRLRCFVPWKLGGVELVAVAPDPGPCAAPAQNERASLNQ